MITNCRCPKEKNCQGHLSLQEQKQTLTTTQYMNRFVEDDIVEITLLLTDSNFFHSCFNSGQKETKFCQVNKIFAG